MTTCLDVQIRLDEFRSGELDATTAEMVRSHLDACGACREEASALRSVSQHLQADREPAPHEVAAARLAFRRAKASSQQDPIPATVRPMPPAWRAVAARAAAIVLSVGLLAPLWSTTEPTSFLAQSDGEASVLTPWLDRVRDTTPEELTPWWPELSLGAWFERAPKTTDRALDSLPRPTWRTEPVQSS